MRVTGSIPAGLSFAKLKFQSFLSLSFNKKKILLVNIMAAGINVLNKTRIISVQNASIIFYGSHIHTAYR